ncbi:MAG: adenylyl-sulfate kinase [Fidelibacterota bacterium]
MNQKSTNVVWHDTEITKLDREERNGHRGVVIWMTGLSGSGKSTIATELQKNLFDRGCQVCILDGDNIRHGLNSDLGFSPADREENIRRIGEVAKILAEAGMIAITAFISPYRSDRDRNRALLKQGEFIEIFVKAPLRVCEERDPKGLYQKARAGKIPEFTGISAPYEEPLEPELIIETDRLSVEESTQKIVDYLEEKGIINGERQMVNREQ